MHVRIINNVADVTSLRGKKQHIERHTSAGGLEPRHQVAMTAVLTQKKK